MVSKKKGGLGRGLGEIFDEITSAYEHEIPTVHKTDEIPIDEIKRNPYQPRKTFNEQQLKELSASIRQHGLLQPIVVVKEMDGYTLIAGERRLRAAKMAHLPTIKATIVDVELAKFHELALIENIQRENLNPIELALSYEALIVEHQMTHDTLAQSLKKSRTQITNTLRLLALNDKAKDALIEEKITQGHAKILVALESHDQSVMVDSIIGQKLSVRETEQMVKTLKEPHTQVPTLTTQTPQLNFSKLAEALAPMGIRATFSKTSCKLTFESEKQLHTFIDLLTI